MTKELIALLDGKKTGRVVRDNRGKLAFIYNEQWRNADGLSPITVDATHTGRTPKRQDRPVSFFDRVGLLVVQLRAPVQDHGDRLERRLRLSHQEPLAKFCPAVPDQQARGIYESDQRKLHKNRIANFQGGLDCLMKYRFLFGQHNPPLDKAVDGAAYP